MKRLAIAILCVFVASVALAQSQQELLQMYRNGTLTQSQIDELRKQYNSQTTGIKRTQNVAATTGTRKVTDASAVAAQPAASQTEGVENADNPKRESSKRPIFGHDLFTSSNLTFEPNLKIATPENYTLGPGDEVIVDLWGDISRSNSYTISPDGRIFIAEVGPVVLAGITIEEASQRLRRAMSAIYEGLYNGSVKMKLSLGSIRSIQVNITGEVGRAGTYTLPSLATLFHALHQAGGVNPLGTMRNIKLYRGGKLFSEVDVYDYILNGKTESDIALRDGDLIAVEAYGKLVQISGQVKRPLLYEMDKGESIADLIGFAGGFTNEANRNVMSVTRRQGGEYLSFTVDAAQYDTFVLEDGDELSVAGSIDRYENRVEVRGAVYREGFYAIDDKMKTLKQLIERADGLREDAFTARAVLYREKPDWTMEVESIDLGALMAGTVPDIPLRANDLLMIAAINDVQEEYNVVIFGSVQSPDVYPYAENMTVEDLVLAAGGLLESAATANVTVTRRIKDPKSLNMQEELFEIFTIELKDGLAVGGDKGFELQPFDQVYVRRSPVYVKQSSVQVRGEVAFEGDFPLSHRNMRLSEIVEAAGGLAPGAFAEGAYLLRKMTDDEMQQSKALGKLIANQASKAQRDETMVLDSINLKEVYNVGINLEQAMKHPGTDADIILRDGDVVGIPQYNGTVRIMGAVNYPNTVSFSDGKKVKYYVKSAGGFDNKARKRRVFVIHMNGMVESGLSARVRPGAIIIIPTKAVRDNRLDWGDVAHSISATASTAAVVVSTIRLATN